MSGAIIVTEETDEHANDLVLDASSSSMYLPTQTRRVVIPDVMMSSEQNDQFLDNVLSQTGENSFGVAAIEVYTFEDSTSSRGRLIQIGSWRHEQGVISDATDKTKKSVSPGVCLVGTLWAEAGGRDNAGGLRRNNSSIGSFLMRKGSSLSLGDSNNSGRPSAAGINNIVSKRKRSRLVWRDLKTIMNDPDAVIQDGDKLTELCESGVAKAAGVCFEYNNGNKGMVVYYTQDGVDNEPLQGSENETYLQRTAALIGSILDVAESRRACVAFRRRHCNIDGEDQKDVEESVNEEKVCVEGARAVEDSSSSVTQQDSSSGRWSWISLRASIKCWLHKFRGGGAQIPPSRSWDESAWTLVGAFTGLLVLSSLNELFHFVSDSEYFLLMGPFGALMTLQYGLTGAPASQPRNAVLGQIVAGAVALSFTYIPDSIMPVWIRQAVAPAFSIAAMVKLGIPHPPAGAHSVIYAEGKFNWGFYGLVVLCSAVSIAPATIVNNMSQKRQYPIYWGYISDAVAKQWKKDKKAKNDATTETERSSLHSVP